MSEDHKRGSKKGKFCGIPGNPCECGNDYIKICEPGWVAHTFARLVNAKTGAFNFQKKYEAHHVVCVAPVSSELIAKPAIEGVIKETAWCINNKDNMLAMPLWGHTVKWYCTITAAGGSADSDVPAPPFANIPQHDWDHNCDKGYTWEVKQATTDLAKEVKDAGHEVSPQDLKGALDGLSADFKSKLSSRGARKEGTHDSWTKAPDKADWCHPFSMAADGKITSKGYPVKKFDESVAKWIKRIAEAIAGG